MNLQESTNFLGIKLHFYGLLIGIAMLIPIFFVEKKFKSIRPIDVLTAVISIIVGARGLYVLHRLSTTDISFVEAISVWDGGLALYGGMIGGALGLLYIAKIRDINFYALCSTVLTFLPLAQAVGRLGNFFNQELYGKPTTLPWAIEILPENRVRGYEKFTTFHPAFLYEIILNFINFVIIHVLVWNLKEHLGYESKAKPEQENLMNKVIIGTYLLNYGIIRVVMNYIRLDKVIVLGFESSDIFSVLSITLGVLFIAIPSFKLFVTNTKAY